MTLERLLEKYGQRVDIHYGGETVGMETRAFVQPVQERGEGRVDRLPTPLGLVRKERLTYLGAAAVGPEDMRGGYVEYRGRRYDARGAQPVYVGEKLSHWWAMLIPRDGEDES